jgi:TP901 family phage tail tape measure protein
MKIVQSIPAAFKKVIAISKELDKTMTDLRVVTGYNRTEAVGLMKSYNGLAKSLGVTTQEVAKSADTWLRQGYSIADTNQLITATMHLSKLGQIESGQASQYMTSMLKGFKLEASDAMSVVDKLVALDKDYAVTAGGVAEALSRTAVSAQMAGVELDKIAAMVTVITDVSQKSADTVGESMKTLFARYGNVKAGVFEDLTDSSGETTENINDIEKVLNSVGISIRSSSLDFREMDDVLEELAGKW